MLICGWGGFGVVGGSGGFVVGWWVFLVFLPFAASCGVGII